MNTLIPRNAPRQRSGNQGDVPGAAPAVVRARTWRRRILAAALLGLFFGHVELRAADLAKGADVGWLPQMEASGYRFLNDDGKPQDCLGILKEHGINTIRLRVWVNPSADPRSGHCGQDEVVAIAQRAQKMGFRLLIDFHYSDSWADPGHQSKPASWANHDFTQLQQDVYDHTARVLKALEDHGVTPEWVQVGNEITNGMLWPDGSTKNWPQLAQLINRGSEAVKAVDPRIKVIVHLDLGCNPNGALAWFDNLARLGGKYDVIGLSYYPWWQKQKNDYRQTIDALATNLNGLSSRFGKEVMVVEVGGEDTKPEDTYAMLVAVQEKVRQVPEGKGIGVVYWEPEGAASWSHYPLSCWGADGRPTAALRAFLPGATGTAPPAAVPAGGMPSRHAQAASKLPGA